MAIATKVSAVALELTVTEAQALRTVLGQMVLTAGSPRGKALAGIFSALADVTSYELSDAFEDGRVPRVI